MFLKTVFGQLLVSLVALVVLALAVFGWLNLDYFRNFHLDAIRAAARREAMLVGETINYSRVAAPSAELDAICARIRATSQSRVTIIATDGRVLAESDGKRGFMDSHRGRPEVTQALDGGYGWSIRHSDTVDAGMMYVAILFEAPDGTPMVIRVATPLSQVESDLGGLRRRMLLAAMALTAVAVLVAAWTARRFTNPMVEIRRQAGKFARGDLKARLPRYALREFDDLAGAFGHMAAQIQVRIDEVIKTKNLQDAILGGMREGVFAIDKFGMVAMANQSARDILNLGSDPHGKPIHGLTRSTAIHGFIDEMLEAGSVDERELDFDSFEGRRRLSLHGQIIRDAAGREIGAVVVVNDVTHMRRLERARQEFVANVSHEIKTPLTAIHGAAETLQDGAIKDKKYAKKFVAMIMKHAERLRLLVDDILALSRLEDSAAAKSLERQECLVDELVDGALDLCAERAAAKNINIRIVCDGNLQTELYPNLMRQALVNLLDNAIKYSEDNSEVRLSVSRGQGLLFFKVRDWGLGIPSEAQPRIFERFYRVDTARSRELGGTGLGLSIVKHIAQSHGGSVSVSSNVGAGSEFTIAVPLSEDIP